MCLNYPSQGKHRCLIQRQLLILLFLLCYYNRHSVFVIECTSRESNSRHNPNSVFPLREFLKEMKHSREMFSKETFKFLCMDCILPSAKEFECFAKCMYANYTWNDLPSCERCNPMENSLCTEGGSNTGRRVTAVAPLALLKGTKGARNALIRPIFVLWQHPYLLPRVFPA